MRLDKVAFSLLLALLARLLGNIGPPDNRIAIHVR
jgi:hypothetical protein